MRRSPLHLGQAMSDLTITDEADAVDKAAQWSEKLLARVHYGPGDSIEAAMHRAEAAYGIPRETFWSLRYRRPKAMAVAAWLKIKAAYDSACASQEAKLRHEIEISKLLPATPARQALVAEAEAILGPGDRDVVATPIYRPDRRIAG